MKFDRKHTQEVCELELGYNSYQEIFSNRKYLKNAVLSINSINKIKEAADKDLSHFYFKALLSFLEAVKSISEKRYSWASVKLYYAVYYLIQVEMIARGSILIRAGGLHRMILRPGQIFYNNPDREYNSDHSGTILHFINLYRSSDPLLSNMIDEKESYLWLLAQRERVNYQERSFNEPNYPDFWNGPISLGTDKMKLESTIQIYIDDKLMLYVFQNDHAILGIPVQRLVQTVSVLKNYGYAKILPEDKKAFLKKNNFCKNLKQFIDY